jgi:hypothetical protein
MPAVTKPLQQHHRGAAIPSLVPMANEDEILNH